MTATEWRKLAAELAAPHTSEELTAWLFTVLCPVCGADGGLGCAPSYPEPGNPVALVRKYPVAYCHFARMTAAVQSGTVTADAVLAQFGNSVPAGFRQEIGAI